MTNKDVGSERWAINYRLSDGFVTASVFHLDGREPSFLSCDLVGNDGVTGAFSCRGAEKCAKAPCPSSDYRPLSDATLPLQFFFPPGAELLPKPDDDGVVGRFANWVLTRGQTTDGRIGLWAYTTNPDGDELYVGCVQFQVFFEFSVSRMDVVSRNFDAYFTWDPDLASAVTSSIGVSWLRGGSGFRIANRFIERLFDRQAVRIKYEATPSDQLVNFDIREARRAITPILIECGEPVPKS